MCGRGACSLDPNALKRICNVNKFINSDKYFPSYNVCPNNFIPVLLAQNAMLKYYKDLNKNNDNNHNNNTSTTSTTTDKKENDESTDNNNNNDQRILSTMRWGLIPSFSKDGKSHFRTINAREDTIKSKPMYRRLINKKRCVVLFNGYYEWKTTKQTKNKQPYFFTPQYTKNDNINNMKYEDNDKPLMYMAALWDLWRAPNDTENNYLFTVSIITTDSNKDVSFCHDRMPLIMTANCIEKWINPEKYTIDECFDLIHKSQRFITIKSHAVPREIVGNTKMKGIECIQTLDEYKAKKRKTGLHQFFKTAKPIKKKEKKEEIKMDKTDKMKIDDIEDMEDMDDLEENLKKAIKESKISLEREKKNKNEEMKMDDIEDEMDEDLKRAIKESKILYKKEEEKRGKKRKFDQVDDELDDDLDELQISNKSAIKKQKLNSGEAKKIDNEQSKRKLRKQ